MTLLRLITPIAVLTAALALPASAAAHHGCSKHAQGAQIIAKTKESHVFVKRDRRYGCASRVGSPKLLPGLDTVSAVRDFDEGRTATHITLSGVFVAYGRYEVYPAGGAGDTQTDVLVVDLRTGRAIVEERGSQAQEGMVSSYVNDLVLKRNGSVAWTSEHHTNQVHRYSTAPGAAGRELLDTGGDIDTHSLALSADRTAVTWTKGGQTRSAPLP